MRTAPGAVPACHLPKPAAAVKERLGRRLSSWRNQQNPQKYPTTEEEIRHRLTLKYTLNLSGTATGGRERLFPVLPPG